MCGTLRLYEAKGRLYTFSGTPAEPMVTIRLRKESLYTKLCSNPELNVGEAYMDGALTFEDGSTS